jgi:hypothetical protein
LASNNGIATDVEQQGKLREVIDEARQVVWAELQSLYPESLRRCVPNEGYKRDSDAERRMESNKLEAGEQWVRREFVTERSKAALLAAELAAAAVDELANDNGDGEPETKAKKAAARKRKSQRKKAQRAADSARRKVATAKPTDPGDAEEITVTRWCRQQPFNPSSSQQIIAYMRHRGHKVPKHAKTDAETSNKEELARLAKKHNDQLYTKVVEHREFDKIENTYVGKLDKDTGKASGGWTPGADGKVHPTFTYAPATTQLSSRGPNSQNRPKRHTFAEAFGQTIIAAPSCRRVNLDYKSFHVLTLGFEADSQRWMDLSRRDMHAFFTGFLLRLPGHEKWFDLLYSAPEELDKILAWVKREHANVRNDKAKRAILGVGNGERAYGLNKRYPEAFPTVRSAQKVLDVLFSEAMAKDVLEYQERIAEVARDQHYLLSRHGNIRYFHDVWHWQQVADNYRPRNQWMVVMRDPATGKRFVRRHGDDYQAAVAYFTQDDAHCHLREAKHLLHDDRTIDERGLLARWGFNNEIHDSLEFDCPRELVDECLHVGKRIMEFRNPNLVSKLVPDGLWCAVEASVGGNGGKRSAENPDGMEEVVVK